MKMKMKLKIPCTLTFVTVALLGCKTTSDDLTPDVRHWGLDLVSATPRIENLEDFLSDIDLHENVKKLEKEHQDRLKEIAELEATDLSQEAQGGRAYNVKKRIAVALMRDATYARAMAARRLFYDTKQWRLVNPELLLTLKKEKEVEESSFKILEATRELATKFTFEPDENQYNLIRMMARQQSQSLPLYYEQFKKSFSASPFADEVEAFLAAGAFDKKDYAKADSLFKALMENKSSNVRPYVAFQVAWLNIARYIDEKDAKKRPELLAKAQVGLRLSIKLMRDWKGKKPSFDLAREAAHDLAWIAAEQGTPAADGLKLLIENDAKEFYRDYQKFAVMKAIRENQLPVAEALIKELSFEQEGSRDFPVYQFMMAEVALAKNDFVGAQRKYEEIRGLFKPEVVWFEKWKDDKILIDLVDQQLGNHIVTTAMVMKTKGEQAAKAAPEAPKGAVDKPKVLTAAKTPVENPKPLTREEYFAKSRDLMRLYAEWYPNGQALDDIRYQSALLEYHGGQVEKAMNLLAAIAKDTKSKHNKEAIYDVMIVTSEWDDKQASPDLPETGKVKSPIALPKSKVLLIEKIEAYLKSEPDAENAINLQYNIASIYHAYGHYEKSLPLFDALLQKAPATEIGQASLNLSLSYLMESKRWDLLLEKCKAYLSNKEVTGAGHRKVLRQTLEYAKSMAHPG